MIIQFTVSNYRCFREFQTLSMVASGDKSLPENCITMPLAGRSNQRWLKGAGLYGANASGKSTLLNALHTLQHLVLNSAKTTDASEPVAGIEPFALAPEMAEVQTGFIINFVADEVQYEYRVAATQERIWHESLGAFPRGREQLWFSRDWQADSNSYIWSPERPTGFKRDPQLESYTLSNMLYLSKAVASNKSELNPVFKWFKDKLIFLNISGRSTISHRFTLQQIGQESEQVRKITKLMQGADLGITKVGIKDQIFDYAASDTRIDTSDMPPEQKEQVEILNEFSRKFKKFMPEKTKVPSLEHRGVYGNSFALPWEAESLGTQRLFALAGPWFDILSQGHVVCIDELESSMHPLMVRALLQHFFSDTENRMGAQIIFTTHNPLLLDTDIMRRDQVWFTEKDYEGVAHLYPLTDYSPRKNESLIRGYLSGRYGGVPFIPSSLTQPDNNSENSESADES